MSYNERCIKQQGDVWNEILDVLEIDRNGDRCLVIKDCNMLDYRFI